VPKYTVRPSSKLRGSNSALLWSHPSHAEQQITEAEKAFTPIEVLIATLSDRWEILYREQGEPTIAAGRFALMELQLGMLVIAISPASPIIRNPVADHRDIDAAVTRVLDACVGSLALMMGAP